MQYLVGTILISAGRKDKTIKFWKISYNEGANIIDLEMILIVNSSIFI